MTDFEEAIRRRHAGSPTWARAAILVARLIFAAVFGMAMTFKFGGISDTANYIAAAGFPFALFLAWVAAFFELALVLCFLTGAFFTEAAIAAGVYVLFLGFAFHGPGIKMSLGSLSTISCFSPVSSSPRFTVPATCWC